eukprot:9308704-Pyramimonas_sp.AAC.1
MARAKMATVYSDTNVEACQGRQQERLVHDEAERRICTPPAAGFVEPNQPQPTRPVHIYSHQSEPQKHFTAQRWLPGG